MPGSLLRENPYEPLLRTTPFVEPPVVPEWDVFEPDGRKHVAETLRVPHRWICSLDVVCMKPGPHGPRRTLGRGSGVLIGPRLVLTAAHCIWGRMGNITPLSVHAAPARNGRTDPFGRFRAVAYRRMPPVPKTNVRRDLAVVLLEKSVATRRHAALDDAVLDYWGNPRPGHRTELAPGPRQGGRVPVVVCGYPGDFCGTRKIKLEDDSCPERDRATTQWRSEGTTSDHDPLRVRFSHTADTDDGQSGSPVWRELEDGRRCLIGIHTDGFPTGNRAAQLGPDVLRLLAAWRK